MPTMQIYLYIYNTILYFIRSTMKLHSKIILYLYKIEKL